MKELKNGFVVAVRELYKVDIPVDKVQISLTKKDFEGDFTIVLFPFIALLKSNPVEIGERTGAYLKHHNPSIESFNVVKGFLNFTLTSDYWLGHLESGKILDAPEPDEEPGKILIEFASPNTNKPLHLGHLRNILLGWSCCKIYEFCGYQVIKTQIVNDRGIAICKSMLAWQKFGNGATPQSTSIKGDHFVGDYYVLFEKKFQEEYKHWQQSPEALEILNSNIKKDENTEEFFKRFKNIYFNEYSVLGKEARELLKNWENQDPIAVSLWKQMNAWVYEGFDVTYKRLGVEFDKIYYESDTYLLGKDVVNRGLESGVFYKEQDGSVWIDLTDVGLDKKIVLRSDGTSVYITQDIGTAMLRYRDYQTPKMVYTVADEQDYHFKVLFEILKKLGEPYADGLYHLSYGMVELPEGKMKSREGTVVDADDIMEEVFEEAKMVSMDRGEIAELSEKVQHDIIEKLALSALKFFIIKVNPRKKMIFDPKESVDLQGQTGPYVLNAYVRIQSIFRKNTTVIELDKAKLYRKINSSEHELLKLLFNFQDVVKTALKQFDPSNIANFAYALAKEFHKFYHDNRILNAETEEAKNFRLLLAKRVGEALRKSMNLLGIDVVDRM